MPALRARRDFLKGLGVAIPASAVLSTYRAMAAPLRKKVKITDLPRSSRPITYLLSFQRHSRFRRVTTFVFYNIPAFRSVFNSGPLFS